MAVTTRGPVRTQVRRVRRTAPRRERRPSLTPSPPLPAALLLAVPFLVLLGVFSGFQVLYIGRIYPGVAALGLNLGGLSEDDAAARLAQRTAELSHKTVTLRLGEQQWASTPADLGVQLDPQPLAAEAYLVGREGSLPGRLAAQVSTLISGTEVAWQPSGPDASALTRFLENVASQVDHPVEEAHLAVQPDFSLDYRPGSAGRRLDVEALEPEVRAALFADGTVDLAPFVHETQPKTTEAQVADARAVAQRVLASPLVLRFNDHQWTVERDTLAQMLSFENPSGSKWSVKLDDAPLRALLGQIASELDQDPQDARLAFDGETVSVLHESKEGQKLDVDAALSAARAAIESDEHIVDLPVEVTKPAVDQNDIPQMGIKELIESSQTSFAGSIPEKQHNIRLAAERLNGVVVPPGETFSFNKEVGPTTLDAGFQWGYGLASSTAGVKTVPSVAGGICQVATTLFQPVFWAGYRIEERNWHLYWIPAYTSRDYPGLDATVDEAAGLDFKFVNDTSTYVLIQSWTDDSTVHFGLYGTKPDWTVDVDKPVITNERKADPTPQYQAQPDQPWGWRLQVSAARDGFDVTIVRKVTRGDDVRTLKLTSSYQPSSNATLIGTKGMPDGVSLASLLTPAPAAAAEEPTAEPTPKPKPTAASTEQAAAPSDAAAATAAPAGEATPAPAQSDSDQGVVQGGAPVEEATAQPTPKPQPTPKSSKSKGKAKPTSTPSR